MIISASRRTDIPAFYGQWMINRLQAGSCVVRNPFNPTMATRVDLRPEAVDCLVFWTRYSQPFLPFLDEIAEMGHVFYFLYTLTGYDRDLEPFLPPHEKRLDDFKRLSEKIGSTRLIWRYDPIIVSAKYAFDFHRRTFQQLARKLNGTTDRVIISFVDYYRKTTANLRKVKDQFIEQPEEEPGFFPFVRDLAAIARSEGLEILSCAEDLNLVPFGVKPGKCIDNELISQIAQRSIPYRKDPSQRKSCRCTVSRDIGAYGSCLFSCLYCYATASRKKAEEFYGKHNPHLEFLG